MSQEGKRKCGQRFFTNSKFHPDSSKPQQMHQKLLKFPSEQSVIYILLLHADKQVKLGVFYLFILQSYESMYKINIVVYLTDKTL